MTIPKALIWQRIRALRKNCWPAVRLKAAERDELVKKHGFKAFEYKE